MVVELVTTRPHRETFDLIAQSHRVLLEEIFDIKEPNRIMALQRAP